MLSEIAPSIPVGLTGDWQDDARIIGAALGMSAETEQMLAAFDRRAAELAREVDEAVGDATVAFVRVRPDSVRVHTNLHFARQVLEDAGLRIPDPWVRTRNRDPLDGPGERMVPISEENLSELDGADHLLVLAQAPTALAADQDEVGQAYERLAGLGLWARLPAVGEDQVYEVGDHWFVGSQRAAEVARDDLREFPVESP